MIRRSNLPSASMKARRACLFLALGGHDGVARRLDRL